MDILAACYVFVGVIPSFHGIHKVASKNGRNIIIWVTYPFKVDNYYLSHCYLLGCIQCNLSQLKQFFAICTAHVDIAGTKNFRCIVHP